METPLFRHPALDFATIHIYEHGTIDYPRNTVDAAIGMGKIVADSLNEIRDDRPFLDTEHGPIHSFKDKRITLPEAFDDEYFRHMQWAHLASGGAAGGMRWPNRHPHTLTMGMRKAQLALSGFMPAIDWLRFRRDNITDRLEVRSGDRILKQQVARFGCMSSDQVLLYFLRRDALLRDGRLDPAAQPVPISVHIPGLSEGPAEICVWDTVNGTAMHRSVQQLGGDRACALPPLVGDYAVALRLPISA